MANEFEGFSVSHAASLDGTTALTGADEEGFKDIYGVREGSITTDEGSFDNTGDDGILSSWFWFNFVNITIKGGYISFDAMSTITGSTVASAAGGLQIPLEP